MQITESIHYWRQRLMRCLKKTRTTVVDLRRLSSLSIIKKFAPKSIFEKMSRSPSKRDVSFYLVVATKHKYCLREKGKTRETRENAFKNIRFFLFTPKLSNYYWIHFLHLKKHCQTPPPSSPPRLAYQMTSVVYASCRKLLSIIYCFFFK